MMRLALAQINCTVGDLEGNCGKVLEYYEQARSSGADLVLFPELAVTGYPPEDLLLKPKFIQDNLDALNGLAARIGESTAVVGFVDRNRTGIYNAAAIMRQGEIKGVYHKMHLPNYAVFDEKRYFRSGRKPFIFAFGPTLFGVNICEDIWYLDGPAKQQAASGARLICNINASPYYGGKMKIREEVVRAQALRYNLTLAYINLVGGQDELVFDGQSMVVTPDGDVIARAEAFREELLVVDVDIPASAARSRKRLVTVSEASPPERSDPINGHLAEPLDLVAEVYEALRLGLKDYVTKNGFKKVLIGLSGGVDSALVAVLAADALGSENVVCVFMPSRYSSSVSDEDARRLAKNLGMRLIGIPIEDTYRSYLDMLRPAFEGLGEDITEENIQARIRGNILMAISNKFGWLVLTTGNKSEMSVGYATLYGDMAGGFAVIKDVPKTLVYRICRYRNSLSPVIPERTLTRAPSAELKPDQKDTDTLPDYEILDPILKGYVEEDKDLGSITQAGYVPEVVSRVVRMVDASEYKRRQAPPGIRITPKAFGKDRRMPITNKYKG